MLIMGIRYKPNITVYFGEEECATSSFWHMRCLSTITNSKVSFTFVSSSYLFFLKGLALPSGSLFSSVQKV